MVLLMIRKAMIHEQMMDVKRSCQEFPVVQFLVYDSSRRKALRMLDAEYDTWISILRFA